MSKERVKKLKGPWERIHSAIWLIGLAIIAIKGWWWPGILVLIAISALVQAAIQIAVPGSVEEEIPGEAVQPEASSSPVESEHPIERLPNECPRCSAPVRGSEVRWTGPLSADCSYCGANLPLK